VQSITELIVRIADLLEAEGRVLRAVTIRLAQGLGIFIIAAGMVTAGMTLVLGAVYIATAERAGAAAGAALAGTLALLMGGFLIWLGRRMGT